MSDPIDQKQLMAFSRFIQLHAPKGMRYTLVVAAQDAETLQSAVLSNMPRDISLLILRQTVEQMEAKEIRMSTFPQEKKE